MAPLFDGDTLIGYAKIARDLTASKRIEIELDQYRETLEARVAERTAELKATNASLRQEIIDRQRIENERSTLLRRIVSIQEDERRRISRDIHDQLGQRLTALRLKIASLKEACAGNPVLHQRVERLEEIGVGLDSEVNFLAFELRPSVLDDLGLVVAIGNFVREWSQHYGIAAEFHASGLRRRRLEPDIETNLYRIMQEALNNTLKYARAANASVLLEVRKKSVILIVEDDGVGFNAADVGKKRGSGFGLGLIGMRERAALFGGTVEIESAPGRGTTIFVRIPAVFAQIGERNGK
jgi:signal transduction histidine kinase